MGCAASCFGNYDEEEEEQEQPSQQNQQPNDHPFRNCACLRCLSRRVMNAYFVIFQRGQVQVAPSSVQVVASSSSTSVVDDSSLSDTYRAPPRPLPYDDPRCSGFHRQHKGHMVRREKASSQSDRESEILRSRNIDSDVESKGTADKWNGSDYEQGLKLRFSETSLKHPSKEVTSVETYYCSSSEDEDVCPTCLEEYTSENPRIILQCSHHFHLSCIYEWMERSDACPVCGKMMVFNETK